MIIFGTRSVLYRLAMITLLCARCGNPAAHTLRKRVMKFTLFFVPLFPISTKFSTQCTFCGAEQSLPKDQALTLQTQAESTHAAQPHPFAGAPAVHPSAPGGQPQNPYQN